MCILRDLHFTLHIIITHVYVCPKQIVLREKWHSSLNSQDRQTQVFGLAANANHYNNRLKFMISMIIVTGKLFHCFCL